MTIITLLLFLNGYVSGVNITSSNANIIRAQLTEGVKIELLSTRDMKRKKKKVRAKTFYYISPAIRDFVRQSPKVSSK